MGNQRKVGVILAYTNIVAKNLVAFMYTPFLLKFVGQSQYGLFQMTNSVMLSLSLLSMGFSSAYVRFYVRFKSKHEESSLKKLNGMYLLIFIAISVLAFLIGLLIVVNTKNIFGNSLTDYELGLTRKLMLIMVFDVAITFISSVFDSNITVNEKFKFQQSRQLLQTFLVPMLCIPMVMSGVGVVSISITQVSITIIFLLLNMRYCLKKLQMKFVFHNLPFELLKEVATFSIFIFLNQIVDIVNNNAPSFLLGIFRGAKSVATFAIAVQIKNMFFMLSTSLSNVFAPHVNNLVSSKNDSEELTDLMIKVGRIQMLVLFFVLGGFIVVGKYFILIWAGTQNLDAYWLIIVMVLPTVVPLSQNVGIEIQKARNQHVFRSVVYIIFAIFNVVITILGSMYIGLLGAAIGYVISIVGGNGILMNWYYRRKMKLKMKRYWVETVPIMFPGIVSTIAILLCQMSFMRIDNLGAFVFWGIVYTIMFIVLYISLVASKYEKRLLFSPFSRRK